MLSEYNCDILLYWVPSGNFWHSYWKLIYPLKMMIFHSYVNVYQRVYRVILPILLISWGLSPRYALRHVDWLGIVISSQLRETTYLAQWNHQGSFTYLRAVGVKHQVFDITKVVWRFGRHSRTCGGRGLDVFPFSNRPMWLPNWVAEYNYTHIDCILYILHNINLYIYINKYIYILLLYA